MPPRSKQKPLQRPDDCVAQLVKLMRHFDFYTNSVGTPMVESVEINGTRNPVEIYSQQFRSAVSRISNSYLASLPLEIELTRLQTFFRGLAERNPRASQSTDILDDCPLIEVVNILLHSENEKSFRGSARNLLEKLNKLARQQGLDTDSRSWPKAANVLSKMLNQRTDALAALNIALEIGRDSGKKRFINLQMRCDDHASTSSPEPSSPKSSDTQKLLEDDDGDDAIFESIKRQDSIS